jgi:hypothetical protein
MFDQLLSRDAVALGLTYIATSLSRKIDQARIDIYHRELSRMGMDDRQFNAAVAEVLATDDKFPSIARIRACAGHKREAGEPYVRGIGPQRDYLADIDAGRSTGGDDQYRGRPGIKPMIERLVYEDAAITVEAIPGEGITDRLKRIVRKAEGGLERMEASATMPKEATQPAQAAFGEL